MTTLYVRDQSGYREAQATDVLDRAQALLAQRYRVGSPVLTSPALTREFLKVHLGACAYAALREQRLGVAIPDAPFFTWNGRTPIGTNSIRNAFRDHLVPRLRLKAPAGTRHPCVHGLRHSFAVRTLLRWYREGLDPNARLNHLSTFLGHVGLHSTSVYLTITGEILQSASQRFEAFASPTLREVRP